MNVQVIEDKKTKLVLQIDGETNTVTNLIKEELWENEHVKAAGYTQEHPLLEKVRFIVETDTSEEPKKAFTKAAQKLAKEVEKLHDEAKAIK